MLMNVKDEIFHVYINHAYSGPYEIQELWELPGFSLQTLVCPHGEDMWQPASQFPDIEHFHDAPDSSLIETTGAGPESQAVAQTGWRAAVIRSNVAYTPLYTRRQVVIDER